MNRFLLISTSLLVSIGSSAAEAQTKEETSAFLKEKLNFIRTWDDGSKHRFDIKFSDAQCSATFATYYQPRGSTTWEKQASTEVDLSQLDPTRTGIDQLSYSDSPNRLQVFAHKSRKIIRRQFYEDGQLDDVQVRSDLIINVYGHNKVTNRTNAEKAVRAMAHLIKLCGGRGELF